MKWSALFEIEQNGIIPLESYEGFTFKKRGKWRNYGNITFEQWCVLLYGNWERVYSDALHLQIMFWHEQRVKLIKKAF